MRTKLLIASTLTLLVLVFVACFAQQVPPPGDRPNKKSKNGPIVLNQVGFVSAASTQNSVTLYWPKVANRSTKFGDEAGNAVQNPQWDPTITPNRNYPICYIMNTPMSVKLYITAQAAVNGVEIKGIDTSDSSVYFDKTVNIGAGPQTYQIDATPNLPNTVEEISKTFDWEIVQGGVTTDLGNSGPHTIYLIYGQPANNQKPTVKRIDYVVNKAASSATGADVPAAAANQIGPDACAVSRFDGTKSISGADPAYTDVWQVMDFDSLGNQNQGDCGTLATLMKAELDLIGITGSSVVYIYARTGTWTGLVQNTPSSANCQVDPNGKGILGFMAGNGWNIYEGCCLFQGKYWMGGTGSSETTAVQVLKDWTTGTAANGKPRHQAYAAQNGTTVPYPPPPNPTN